MLAIIERPIVLTTRRRREDHEHHPDHARPRRDQARGSSRPGRAATSRSVAARIVLVAERLADTADLHAGWRVLDVATGSGNAAIAAARLGCEVVGVDYVPSLLERGRVARGGRGARRRAARRRRRGAAFPDASFDAVLSVFGSMFAPDQERAAAELLRVSRPGGTIALASWTPDGFIGEMFVTIGAHVAAAGRRCARRCAGEPRSASASCSATGSRRSACASASSSSASARRASSSTSSAARTGRPRGRSPRSTPTPGPRSRKTSSSSRLDYDRLGGGVDAIAIPAAYTETIARKL